MTTHRIEVPALGESTPEAVVGSWTKEVGDLVSRDEVLVELETDKVAIEVIAPANGVLSQIDAQEGSTVSVGQALGSVTQAQGASATAAVSGPSGSVASSQSEGSGAAANADNTSPSVMPAAARVMVDAGVEQTISGTGRDGRVLKEDVERHVATASGGQQKTSPLPVSPTADSSGMTSAGEESSRRVRMSPLRRTIANRLKDAQNTAAILTTFNDVDMTAILQMRKEYRDAFEKKHGIKLGFMGFFVKAAVAALREVPALNSEIDDKDIVYHNHVHVGIAVGTPKGLVVPVIRHADELSVAGIEKAVAGYGVKAREGKLALDDMRGGTFTITNGGVFGSLLSTPILNAPQSGIVGMHRTEKRAVVRSDGSIVARDMMYLALSYDHRVVDGQEAVTFLVKMKNALEDPSRMLLEV